MQAIQNSINYNGLAKQEASERIKIMLAKEYLLYMIMLTYPGYRVSWHHQLICEYLDRWVNKEIKRLMIFAPPRHGKSVIVSERLPAYIIGKYPQSKVIASSYSQSLVNKMSRSARACIEGYEYQTVFPGVVPSVDRWAVEEWVTVTGGSYKGSGVRVGITGLGFDYGIIDDPHKDRESSESKAVREKTIDWYHSIFYTRRQPGASILLMLTRWHEDDLAGHLLKKQAEDDEADQWTVIDLPAILDEYRMDDDPREIGEALWPSETDYQNFPLTELQKTKANIGSYDWFSLYQQRPQPPGGGKIKRGWFQVIDKVKKGLKWVRFWDLAVSTKTSADYTASIALAVDSKNNIYIKDMVRDRWEWPDARREILETAINEKYPIGIEEAGQQKGLIDDLLADREFNRFSIQGFKPEGDKLTRALPWIAKAEAGKVFILRGSWVNEFLNECQLFTGHGDKHDDQIDAISGAYKMASEYDPTGGIHF